MSADKNDCIRWLQISPYYLGQSDCLSVGMFLLAEVLDGNVEYSDRCLFYLNLIQGDFYSWDYQVATLAKGILHLELGLHRPFSDAKKNRERGRKLLILARSFFGIKHYNHPALIELALNFQALTCVGLGHWEQATKQFVLASKKTSSPGPYYQILSEMFNRMDLPRVGKFYQQKSLRYLPNDLKAA
jgi:hypothetical protein